MIVRVMSYQEIDDKTGEVVKVIDDFRFYDTTRVEADLAWRAAQNGARSVTD
jgi:hypothetical protein